MRFLDILGRFQQVREHADGGYQTLCPAHADSSPSLRVWRGDDGTVRVHCRAGCDAAEVVKAAGLTWPEMFRAEGPGLVVSSEPRKFVTGAHLVPVSYYVGLAGGALMASGTEEAEAREYAADRFGIDRHTAESLTLGYHAEGSDAPHASRAFTTFPRLVVPFRNFAGELHGLQGRDLSGACPGRWVGLMNPEGYRWGLYGVFRGQGGYGVTIVSEGPGDGLTAAAVGYDAVAVRGASLAGSPELLAELAAGLRGTQVIAAGDADPAGHEFNRRLAEGLKAHGITVYTLAIPHAGDDLTDWRARNPDRFPDALHRAVSASLPVQDAHEARQEAFSAEVNQSTGADFATRDEGLEALRVLKGMTDQYGEAEAIAAYALVAWTQNRIKYASGLGFYQWTGRVWERSEVKVRQEIHRMGAALALAGDVKAARQFLTNRSIEAILAELRSVPAVHVDAAEFDARPDLLSFRNGTVDLRTGVMRPHAKDDLLTYCLDIDYRPQANCPRWEGFLREIFPDNPELPPYMQRMIGYGITGSVAEQCFAVLWGKGANGKSVLTDTLTHVFRRISKTTPFATFEEKSSGGIPNDLAALRGARLVMASEGESGKPMSEAILKRVTGKDMIAARFLRQEFFEFKPTFLLMLATNHKPRFKGQDEGLWRRVKMIPFRRYFAPSERDYDLDQKLMAEAEGIAAWAVRGAVQWYAEGLGDPEVIKAAVKEYRETSDALAGFYPGVLEPCEDSIVIGSDAFSAYLDWCEAENLPQRERWTRRAFYVAMEERGVTRKSVAKGVALVGVRNTQVAGAGPGIFSK
jgi:putative DNA primase/helicase